MSIAPLPNPKKLSYSGLKWQVRELARRMNLLTQMEAKTIESTGAPKFVFSYELARLDVPSVADVVTSLTDLKTAYDESITSCESTNAALESEIATLVEQSDQVHAGNLALAAVLGVDYAWSAHIRGNTGDTYPPGHKDYGKDWSTTFVMSANVDVSGTKLNYSTTKYVTGPLSGAPSEYETNGIANSTIIRPLDYGVAQLVTYTTKPYFVNAYYTKFYGTSGTVSWQYTP